MFDKETLTEMWYSNPDGAGMMYPVKGAVLIEKGYMSLKKLLKAVDRLDELIDVTETPIVMHFRIGTHGANIPQNTHPFPISSDVGHLKKLICKTRLGVVHNGIIPITPRTGISDTMEYIASQLSPLRKMKPDFYKNPHAHVMMENATKSKLAFIDGAGDIQTIGAFIEDDGYLYSNSTYLKRTYSYSSYGGYYDDDYIMYDRFLMELNKGEAIISFTDGSTDDCTGYSVDERGLVFFYEWDEGIFFPEYGATACDQYGEPIEYDASRAEQEIISWTSHQAYLEKMLLKDVAKEDYTGSNYTPAGQAVSTALASYKKGSEAQ